MSSLLKITRRALTIGLLCCMGAAIPASAQLSAAHEYFTDVALINQDGRTMRFYSDVLQGNVVVINTFFSTCEGICPVINRNIKQLQERLSNPSNQNLVFVSITVDPLTDTPDRLKQYAEEMDAQPGWIFLTGTKENVDLALSKLGQTIEDKEEHTNILFIGNEPTGLWKKALGLATTEDLSAVVESVLHDRGE